MRAARSKKRALGVVCVFASLAAGCEGPLSALDPKGPAAQTLADLTWTMVFGATAIFVVVMALAAYAVFRAPGKRRRISPAAMIAVGGVAFPAVVLSALLFYGVAVTGALRAPAPGDALEIHVTARQFVWEVRYPGAGGGEVVAGVNEIRMPSGRPVVVRLTSADVIHSFWVPNLAGKIDVIPGRVTRLTLHADRPGRFRGQCAEFCGAGHAHMAFEVVALVPEEFGRWLDGIGGRAP